MEFLLLFSNVGRLILSVLITGWYVLVRKYFAIETPDTLQRGLVLVVPTHADNKSDTFQV